MEKNIPIVTLVVISRENDPNFIGSRFIIATWISSRKNTKFCKEVRSITLAENFIHMLVKMIIWINGLQHVLQSHQHFKTKVVIMQYPGAESLMWITDVKLGNI